MNLKRLFGLFTLSFLIASTVAPQVPSSRDTAKADKRKIDEEKVREALEKKALSLLDDVLKEAPSLRLTENRIRIQARAAWLLWKHNEKRARSLFKQSTDSFVELLASEDGVRSSQGTIILEGFGINQVDHYPGLLQARAQLRQEVLQLLTTHDARLARDFLRATASPGNREKSDIANMSGETEMDLNLAAQIAGRDPKQALQIAEEHLEKGLPYGLINVLSRLQKDDTEAARKLAGGIMKRLRSKNIVINQETAMFILSLLGQKADSDHEESDSDKQRPATRNLPALVEDNVRELIDILVTAALSQPAKRSADSDGADEEGDGSFLSSLETLMPKIEKYAPSRAPLLRKKMAEQDMKLDPESKAYKEYQTLIEQGDSKVLMDAASKASPQVKGFLIGQTITKAIGEGEFDRARQITDEQIIDAEQRKQMLAYIDREVLQRAGKVDEARHILSRLSPEERATVLAQFAAAALGKGDKKTALQLLDEARGLISAQATNYVELGALIQIAQSYASVEPARSFDIIEPTIEQLNILLSATATLDGFEYWRHFKEGELVGVGPSPVVNAILQCARDLALISPSDFDRAKADADRFNRSDVRIMARLFVAQGILSNQLPIRDLPVSGRRVFHTPF